MFLKRWAAMACVVVAGLFAALPAWAQTRELVIAAWGDPYEAGWRKSLVPEFEKKHNVKVVWVQGFSSQTLAKLRAQKDKPEIDVAMLDDGPHQVAVQLGLIEKIDRTKLPDAKDFYDNAFEAGDFGLAFGYNGAGLYYNTKIFKEKGWSEPNSWMDLFRPELKGRVTFHNIANGNGLGAMLAINQIMGGDDNNVDKGFDKLKELGAHVITFDKFGETPTLFQQGEAWLGTWSIDRVANLAGSGAPIKFVFPKEGVSGWKEVVTIVKGRPNQDLAYAWINMVMSRKQQENTAKFVGLGPVNKTATVDDTTAQRVLYGANVVNKMIIPKWEIVNAKRAEWTERWNQQIERK